MLSFYKITIISGLFQKGKECMIEMNMIDHIHHTVTPKNETDTSSRRLTLSSQ